MKKGFLSIFLCILLMVSSTGVANAAPAYFIDIRGHWAEQAINEVIDRGFMQGMGEDENGNRIFAPEEKVSRAQAAAVLVSTFRLDFGQARFIKQPLASDYYNDVNIQEWYAGALAICTFNSIFENPERLFRPDQPISRYEMAQAIQRCFKAKDIDIPMIMKMPDYEDTGNLSAEAQQTIAFITNTGVMKGSDGYFRPDDTLSRGELAQILSTCTKVINMQVDIAENNNGQEFTVNPGESFVLALPSNPTTGYQWDFASEFSANVINLVDSYYQPESFDTALVGSGGTSYWRFKAVDTGITEIKLRYARPWESVQPIKTFTLKVNVAASNSPGQTEAKITTRSIKESSKEMIVDMQVPLISGLKNKEAESSINALWLKDAIDFKTSVASGLADYLKNGREQGVELNPFGSYSSCEICTITPDYLSMYVDYYQYTGGAHGITDRKAYNINLGNGEIMELHDLFAPGYNYHSTINQAISDKVKSTPELYFEGAFSGIDENQEFYIRNSQLVIYFQQYEIAAYAVGIPEFSIPLSQIFPGIKPDLRNSLENA